MLITIKVLIAIKVVLVFSFLKTIFYLYSKQTLPHLHYKGAIWKAPEDFPSGIRISIFNSHVLSIQTEVLRNAHVFL